MRRPPQESYTADQELQPVKDEAVAVADKFAQFLCIGVADFRDGLSAPDPFDDIHTADETVVRLQLECVGIHFRQDAEDVQSQTDGVEFGTIRNGYLDPVTLLILELGGVGGSR